MKKTKEIHPIWVEWSTIPPEMKRHLFMKKSLVGKWHYHYENKNGIIGLIKIQMPTYNPKNFMERKYVWEACGVLEYRRFATKQQAEHEIFKALKETVPK